MRMRWRTIIECTKCLGPHPISWFGIAPPPIGQAYAHRCPMSLKLALIDASKLTWDVAEGYAGRVIIVAQYAPEAELLEMDQSQPY